MVECYFIKISDIYKAVEKLLEELKNSLGKWVLLYSLKKVFLFFINTRKREIKLNLLRPNFILVPFNT